MALFTNVVKQKRNYQKKNVKTLSCNGGSSILAKNKCFTFHSGFGGMGGWSGLMNVFEKKGPLEDREQTCLRENMYVWQPVDGEAAAKRELDMFSVYLLSPMFPLHKLLIQSTKFLGMFGGKNNGRTENNLGRYFIIWHLESILL